MTYLYFIQKNLNILVDEYQDTNFIQSEWLKSLSATNMNICWRR